MEVEYNENLMKDYVKIEPIFLKFVEIFVKNKLRCAYSNLVSRMKDFYKNLTPLIIWEDILALNPNAAFKRA